MESMKIREQYEIAGVNDTGDNLNSVPFSPVNNDKHRVAHVSANFHKNSKRPQWDTQGPWGNGYMKKLKSKITY
jgi:hypothetical protein